MWVVRLGHHDVDLLVGVADLERLRLWLIDLGFVLKYTWDDERWIRHDAGDAGRSCVLTELTVILGWVAASDREERLGRRRLTRFRMSPEG